MEIFPVKSRSENCHISISFGRKKLLVSVSVLAETNIENIGDYWYWPKWIKKAFRSYPTQKSICHNKNIFSGAIHRLVGCLLGTGLNNLMVNTYSVFTTNSCMRILYYLPYLKTGRQDFLPNCCITDYLALALHRQ